VLRVSIVELTDSLQIMEIFLDFFDVLVEHQELSGLLFGTFHSKGENLMNVHRRVFSDVLSDLVDFEKSISKAVRLKVCEHSLVLQLQLNTKKRKDKKGG